MCIQWGLLQNIRACKLFLHVDCPQSPVPQVLLQSSFWTGSMEMGMGVLSGLQLSFGITRNGSQLGGVNMRVLGLFSNSSPFSYLGSSCMILGILPPPFMLPCRRKGGNDARPRSSHRTSWYTSKRLPTLFCSNLFTQSQIVKHSFPNPIYPISLPRLRVKIPQKCASEVCG